MKFDNLRMVNLKKGELEWIERWLMAKKGCPREHLCKKVFNINCEYNPCPCSLFENINELPGYALDILEYNGYELQYSDPTHYPRLMEDL